MENFATAIGLDPNAAEPYIARGTSYLALNDPKAALSDLSDAVNRDKRSAVAWANRGVALETLGQNTDARRSYNRALGIDASNSIARDGIGRLDRS